MNERFVNYHDISHRCVKIHKDSCTTFIGRVAEATRHKDGRISGSWSLLYLNFRDAKQEAEELENRVHTCMHCMEWLNMYSLPSTICDDCTEFSRKFDYDTHCMTLINGKEKDCERHDTK